MKTLALALVSFVLVAGTAAAQFKDVQSLQSLRASTSRDFYEGAITPSAPSP